MSVNPERKPDVLLAALAERYEVLRVLRERVQNVGLWALGLMTAAAGWLIQSDAKFSFTEHVLAVVGAVGAVAVLRFVYLADLEKGFRTQQQVTARVEKALGFYEPGALNPTDAEPLYPPTWADAGTRDGPGRFFQTTYVLIYLGLAFLVASIMFAA